MDVTKVYYFCYYSTDLKLAAHFQNTLMSTHARSDENGRFDEIFSNWGNV